MLKLKRKITFMKDEHSPYVRVELTQGKFMLVDTDDLEIATTRKWSALYMKSGKLGNFYAAAFDNTKHKGLILFSRFLLDAQTGAQVDHVNGDTLDNRRSNLRLVSRAQNQQNRIKHTAGSSKYKGVHATGNNKNPWQARITVKGKTKYLGSYKTEVEAAHAYNYGAVENFGKYARINILTGGK